MSLFESIGSVDNLDEPTPLLNHRSVIYGFIITFLTITTLCATLRLYVRFFVTRCPGWDDYFIILILAISWVTNIGSLFLVNVGLGRHFTSLTYDGMKRFIKMFWWCNACYNMAMTAIKLSLLFQYLRLVDDNPEPDRKQPKILKAIVKGLLAITAIWGLIYSILAWVPCAPISADWNFDDTTATRYGYGSVDTHTFVATYLVHGACNMTIDIAIFALPLFSRSMWATAGRQRQSRIAMICLYGLGVVSVVCSIVRFVSLVQHKATTYPVFDPTWYGPTAIVLSILEVDIATIMASLPVFWPYLRRNIDRIMITHEIEVKVTEHFTQIDDQSTDGGHTNVIRSGHHGEGRRSESNTTYTPWADRAGNNNNNSGNLKMGTEVVMMRDLGRSGTAESQRQKYDDVPFDGTRGGGPTLRSPSRSYFMKRESKEVLLRE